MIGVEVEHKRSPGVDRIGPVIDKSADEACHDTARSIAIKAAAHAPVRTGYLKSTIDYQKLGPSHYVISADARYAGYVEFGTRHMAAQPFMRPAIEETRVEIKARWNMTFTYNLRMVSPT